MTDLEIRDGQLVLTVEGMDRIWSLHSHLTLPLEHVTGARAEPDAVASIPGGIKLAGAGIPGTLRAGIFVGSEGRVFWDVHGGGHSIVISLADERYSELVVDVEDPAGAVNLINSARGSSGS